MYARRPAVALLAALALFACGPSKEEERIKELKRICEDAVGKTVYDLELQYASSIRLHVGLDGTGAPVFACGTDISTLQCTPGPSRCVLGFWFPPSNDPNTCKQGRCFFTCDVRAELADLKATAEDHLATVCGTRWAEHLDSPGPFYYDPALASVTLP